MEEKRPKYGGRQKGTPNKDTLVKVIMHKNMWEKISDFVIGNGLEKLQTELEKLKEKDYVYAFLNLLEYFKPRLKSIDARMQSDSDLMKLIPLMPEELRNELIIFIDKFTKVAESAEGARSEEDL